MVSIPRRLSEPSTACRIRAGRLETPRFCPGRGIDVEAELGRDHDAIAERSQSFADDLLVLERPIDLGGVEEGHALVRPRRG